MSAVIGWAEARRRFEEEDATLTELAPLLDCTVGNVSYHAKRQGWAKITGLDAELRAAAIRGYVARASEHVLANLERKHALTERITRLVERHVARHEVDAFWAKVIGHRRDGEPILVDEDPSATLLTLARTLKTCEDVDAQLLRDGPWREAQDGPKLPPLPADFNFLEALRKPRKPEQEMQ